MVTGNTTSADIRAEIISMAEDRFAIEGIESLAPILKDITPKALTDNLVISLRRKWKNNNGIRILLIAALSSQEEVKDVLQWAAAVKDELTEPVNGDIYLFIAINDSISVEQCTDIESNDRICRRYVLRPNESLTAFLERSFIAPAIGNEKTSGIDDPLQLALEKTSKNYTWLNSKEQHAWRTALLSSKNFSEIINSLLKIR